MSVSAKTVYLKAGQWTDGGAKFGCHTWGSSNKSGFMTHVEGDVYKFETLDANTDVIFTRVASGATGIWDKEWDRVQTTFQSGKDMFVITDWKAGKWDVYAPAVTHTFAKNSTIYLDFRTVTTKGADIPKADKAETVYDGNAGGNVIPVTFTADVKWVEGQKFLKTAHSGWSNDIPFKAPEAGQNCAQVAADGKSYTWTTYSEPSVTLSLDKESADAGTAVTVTLTATADNVAGEVTYAFQYSTDNATWNNISSTGNTATQTFTAETRYYKVTMTNGGNTKESTAKFSAIKFHVIGSWDDWAAHNEVVEGSKTITLEANKTYEYKITNGTWDLSWGNDGTMERSNCTDWSFESNNNAKIKTDEAGDYVFNVSRNAEGKVKVSVTYPALPLVEAYNVTVPEGTLACYISGSFDEWAEFHKMSKVDATHYTISIPDANTGHKYKYSSGPSWDFEEVTVDGGHVDSRTYNANDVVAKWKAVYDPDAVPQELVYNVTVPAGTTACYIAMDTDPTQEGWEFTAMTKVDDTHYTLTRTGLKADAYKYACQADWNYAEKDADGNDIANRQWAENDVVAKWGVPPTYTIVGATAITGENWNLASTNNIMIKDGEAYTLTKTGLKLETGDYEYKVAKNGAWGDGQYPAEGNQKVTITETAEYTIVYTYTVGTSLTAVATKTGEYTPVQTVYTVAGDVALCGTNWKADDTANDMTANGDGTFTWTKTGVKLTDNAGFKVVKNHDFGNGAYPANDWVINIEAYEGAAVYTVTITFTESSKEIAVTLTKTGEATPPVISYVLMGVNGDWDNGIALTQNPGNEDEYVLENQVIIKATDAVKVVTLTDGTATAWCGDVDSWSNATYTADAEGNIVLEDGIYTFYFKKSANNIYINQTGYARNVTNTWGTICLPYASSSHTGAEFYEVSWVKEGTALYLDQLAADAQLEAGKPYIFKATDSKITVTYTGDAKAAPVAGENGLTGTFTDIAASGVLVDNYIIAQNQIWVAGTSNTLPANRAYIDKDGVPTTEQPKLAGRRRVCMGENASTGLDNITNGENTTIKVIENGQLVIIRNGEKFNAQGIKL